ncbi:MAG: polysaccharide deacetylase [Ignavibacteria bacterium]|nr:polysaccharide deacetylase [Ignavibacteria bacterium]
MSLKSLIIKSSPYLVHTGIHNLTGLFYRGIGHILNFHRIIPKQARQRIHQNSMYELTPDYFSDIVDYFVKKKYIFPKLTELQDLLRTGSKQKFVIFTFDDGYRDNLEFAYPILKKFNIPMTIYCVVNFIERKSLLWWNILEDVILKHKTLKLKLNNIDNTFNCNNFSEKADTFRRIHNFLNDEQSPDFEENIGNICKFINKNPYEYTSELILSKEDLIEVFNEELIEIGSHSVSHKNLSKLSEIDARYEITESKTYLEQLCNKPINHFAYPYGSRRHAGSREFEYANQAGYQTAVTTRQANIFNEHSKHLFALPRIEITSHWERFGAKKTLDYLIGLNPMIYNKFQKFVTK